MKINKRHIQKYMEDMAYGKNNPSRDPSIMSQDSQMDISSITSEHNRRLNQLREQYEYFLKNAETEFFNVLKSVKGESEVNSEENENSPQEKNFNEEFNKYNIPRQNPHKQSNESSHVSISTLNDNFQQKEQTQFENRDAEHKQNLNKGEISQKLSQNLILPENIADTNSKSGYINTLREETKERKVIEGEEEYEYPPLKMSASKRIQKKKEKLKSQNKSK